MKIDYWRSEVSSVDDVFLLPRLRLYTQPIYEFERRHFTGKATHGFCSMFYWLKWVWVLRVDTREVWLTPDEACKAYHSQRISK